MFPWRIISPNFIWTIEPVSSCSSCCCHNVSAFVRWIICRKEWRGKKQNKTKHKDVVHDPISNIEDFDCLIKIGRVRIFKISANSRKGLWQFSFYLFNVRITRVIIIIFLFVLTAFRSLRNSYLSGFSIIEDNTKQNCFLNIKVFCLFFLFVIVFNYFLIDVFIEIKWATCIFRHVNTQSISM